MNPPCKNCLVLGMCKNRAEAEMGKPIKGMCIRLSYYSLISECPALKMWLSNDESLFYKISSYLRFRSLLKFFGDDMTSIYRLKHIHKTVCDHHIYPI